MSEQNKAVVRRLIEDHWNAKNGALVSELFAPTVAIHTPDGVLNGLDGASALLQAYATANISNMVAAPRDCLLASRRTLTRMVSAIGPMTLNVGRSPSRC